MKLPTAVGVPLIVITLADQEAVTPDGKSVAGPMPVAPVVNIVIDRVKAVFTVNVGLDDAVPAVLSVQGVTGITVTVGVEPPAALSATTVNL